MNAPVLDISVTGAKFVSLTANFIAIAGLSIFDLGFGQPINVIIAAGIGSFVGVWNGKQDTRKELVKAWATSMVLTVGALVVIPEWTGYKWSSSSYQAAIAMLMGYTAQEWGPRLSDILIKKFFVSKKEKDNGIDD